MSNAAIKDILDWQSEIRRKVEAGSYKIQIEELRNPKGYINNGPREAAENRVIEL